MYNIQASCGSCFSCFSCFSILTSNNSCFFLTGILIPVFSCFWGNFGQIFLFFQRNSQSPHIFGKNFGGLRPLLREVNMYLTWLQPLYLQYVVINETQLFCSQILIVHYFAWLECQNFWVKKCWNPKIQCITHEQIFFCFLGQFLT